MGRYAIIMVVGFSVIVGMMKLNLNRNANQAQDQSSGKMDEVNAQTLAASAAQLSLYQLSCDIGWRDGYSNYSLNGGSLSATITDHNSDPGIPAGCARISTMGLINGAVATSQVLVQLNAAAWPASVEAGVTARCDISTNGTMLVDGRDHDWNGVLIPNNGMKAISTTQDFDRDGNSTVGGTAAGIDVAPTKMGFAAVVSENKAWPNGYPVTPDLVMGGSSNGYPEGTLKTLAQSGANGSQYVTDPASLHFPLRGITFVELPSGGTWQAIDFGSDSRGILIVHNANTNALIKNLNGGTFRGLIIADDMVHIHNRIIGAVFLLTVGPSEGNCVGNGTGSLLFCREAINSGVQGAGGSSVSVVVKEYWE